MTEPNLIKELALRMRLSVNDIEFLVHTAPRRYKTFPIMKRNGTQRLIAQPSVEIKALQRHLMQLSPNCLVAHRSATAYEVGCSIVKNAEIHSGKKWIAKFDFKNFFPNIRAQNWAEFLSTLKISGEYSELSSRVFFFKKGSPNLTLSVGAPSSPFVSNRIMFKFDEGMTAWAESNGFSYSRYADDMTFGNNDKPIISEIERNILQNLSTFHYCKLNKAKTRIFGPGQRKIVTGIVLSNDGTVGLGRKLKRNIESAVHNLDNEKATMPLNQLRGYLGLLKMANPADYEKLRSSYAETFLLKKL